MNGIHDCVGTNPEVMYLYDETGSDSKILIDSMRGTLDPWTTKGNYSVEEGICHGGIAKPDGSTGMQTDGIHSVGWMPVSEVDGNTSTIKSFFQFMK